MAMASCEFHYNQEALCKLRLLRTYESHYELPKRHNHLVSAKYGVAKFSRLNFALHVAYMPSRRLRRLDMPLA